MSPYFLSFLFALREKQSNIPLGERRQRHKDYMCQSPFHSQIIILSVTMSSNVLQATKPIFFWIHSTENCTRCPPKTFPNDIPSSATTAFGLEHDMPQESHNFSIRTGKHFKSWLEEHHHQSLELKPHVMSHTWTQHADSSHGVWNYRQ